MTRFAVLVALACSAAACVPNKMYRTSGNPQDPDPSKRYFAEESLTTRQIEPWQSDQTSWPYRLAFVEFDDRGEMFKRAQLNRAVAEILRAREDSRRLNGGSATLVLFVHGWKNNASEGSGNVWGFRQVVAGVSKQNNATGRKAPVVGVYIGWRGAVISAPLLKEFTFFDRQRKSQNLPASHFVEALTMILQAARGPAFTAPDPAATLLIGHSFGGAVIETAMEQTLVGIAMRAKTAEVTPRWPFDLMLLVNEAQEATRSFQLIDALHANGFERDRPQLGDILPRPDGCLPRVDAPSTAEEKRPPDAPVIVSISSTGDTATRLAFVGGQSVQRPFNSLRAYTDEDPNFLGFKRQTPMFLNTTAHRQEFQSHAMGKCACAGPVDGAGRCEIKELRCESPAVEAARLACRINITTTLDKVTYAVVEKPRAKNRTPYWVLQMPPSVVPDHSTIFTPLFRDFVISLLQLTIAPR